MRKAYPKKCWYIVDGWICEGYMDKYGFHLTEKHWEESAYKGTWRIKKKDIFYNEAEALKEFKRRYGHQILMQYITDKMADYI